MANFTALGLPPALEERLATQAIVDPTPVQEQAIPPLLVGKDAILQSQTGTGKTLAYLLPLVARLDRGLLGAQALVIVPTQELGIQVRDVARSVLDPEDGVLAAIGGANPQRQKDALKKGPRVIVGTPGRIREFIRGGQLVLDHVRTIIIDEVDDVLEGGKVEDVQAILRAAPPRAQRVFCSATMGEAVQGLASKILRNPVEVKVASELKLPASLRHAAFLVERREQAAMIRRLIRHYQPEGAIAFIGHGTHLRELVMKLKHDQLTAAALTGEAKKEERTSAMRDFRAGRLQLLVATDLAARGLDFGHVGMIINYDMPIDAEHYVHRVGRTARMGKDGLAVTLVDPAKAWLLEKYEKALGIQFERPIFRHGEMREATDEDVKREVAKVKATVRKAKAAEAAPAKKKKAQEVGPSAKAVAKGKAKKAKKKAAGTWKKGSGTPSEA